MPFLQHLVVEGLVVGVAEFQMAYVEVAQVVGIGVGVPRFQAVEPLAAGIVVGTEVAAEDERLDVTGTDLQPLCLQSAVPGVEVAVLNGSPRLSLFANLRTLAPYVEAPLGLCGQCVAHLLDAVLLFLLALAFRLLAAAAGQRDVNAGILGQLDERGQTDIATAGT